MSKDGYLPPGCNDQDIPGNNKKDEAYDKYTQTYYENLREEYIDTLVNPNTDYNEYDVEEYMNESFNKYWEKKI